MLNQFIIRPQDSKDFILANNITSFRAVSRKVFADDCIIGQYETVHRAGEVRDMLLDAFLQFPQQDKVFVMPDE